MLRKEGNLRKTVSFLCVLALMMAFVPGFASAAPVPSGWMGADDTLSVDATGLLRNRLGQEVMLRGTNLGGWMQQETWMGVITSSASHLETWTTLENRFGVDVAQELMTLYQDNFIQEADFEFLKTIGINFVRLPFFYRNFMSDNQGTFINNDDGSAANTTNPGFQRLDWAIDMCRQRGIYVMLDLHGAVGGNSTNHSTGTIGVNDLYTNDISLQATLELWKALAYRYKDDPVVCAYDLMNEPQNNNDDIVNTSMPNMWAAGSPKAIRETNRVYTEMYKAVRSVDPETICAFEAIWTMQSLPDDAYTRQWDHNVMYSMHLYDTSLGNVNTDGTIRYRVNEMVQVRNQRGVAVNIGEFNNGDTVATQDTAFQLYNDNHISYNQWTYKIAGASQGGWSMLQQTATTAVNVNPGSNTLAQIRERWGPVLRTFAPGTVFTKGANPPTINNYTYNHGNSKYARMITALNYVIPGVVYGPVGGDAAPSLPLNTIATPEITPSQEFSDPQNNMQVVITCDDSDASIRYTIDGSAPSAASTLYSGPFTLDVLPDGPVTVRAMAFKGDDISMKAKAVYTVKENDAPVFGADTIYGLTAPFSLKLFAAPDADIYYSINGGADVLYTGPIPISATAVVKAYAAGLGMSKSKIVERKYIFGAAPDDIKMYHDFTNLTGVTRNSTSNTTIELSTSRYLPFSTSKTSLAFTVSSAGAPSATNRSVRIDPQAGGTFSATGYDYLIIWQYSNRTDSTYMRFNASTATYYSGLTDDGTVAGEWTPIVIRRGVLQDRGQLQWVSSVNSFTRLDLGKYSAATYNIGAIYFAKSPDAVPASPRPAICQAVVSPIADQNFTGSPINPDLTLTYNGQTLVLGRDYTVAFSGNTSPGTATARITGIGDFDGTITEQFSIVIPRYLNLESSATITVRKGYTSKIVIDTNCYDVTFTSAVPMFATVDSDGVVRGVLAGITVIRVVDSVSGLSLNVAVNVVN